MQKVNKFIRFMIAKTHANKQYCKLKFYTKEYIELRKLFNGHQKSLYIPRIRFLFGAIYFAFSKIRKISIEITTLL